MENLRDLYYEKRNTEEKLLTTQQEINRIDESISSLKKQLDNMQQGCNTINLIKKKLEATETAISTNDRKSERIITEKQFLLQKKQLENY